MNKINLKEAIGLSRQLAEMVSKSFVPDVIIAIKDGGVLPGIEISEKLGKSLHGLNLKRVIDDRFDKEYSAASEIEKEKISRDFNTAWFSASPKLLEELEFDLTDKKVLLVDDAVHTGKTFGSAKEYLLSLNPKIVKTATLFYAGDYVPDYSLGRGEKRYPWSTWAKFGEDYSLYESYLKDHPLADV